ncbi:MAG TPA: response regulator [Kofleriaceae bacterium]|nr:response regulator [Kofleriaceae bacterium]
MRMAGALNKVSVLVVEDDPDTREIFTLSLGAVGAQVRSATSAEAALAVLASWKPDIVLCDLHLPGVDGYSLIEHVHADARWRTIPMISISGSHPEIEVERSQKAGFARHLTKPSKLADIVKAVASVRPAVPA